MSFDVKVVASGIIALCLVLSAVMFMSSAATPNLSEVGDKFLGLAVMLIIIVVLLALAGIKLRLP